MMLDADHFKRFNDEHGHDAGDLVLNKIGQMLEKCIRKEDVACRYGGEEFTVVLIDADLEFAEEVAERIRLQASEIQLYHQGQPLPSITLSVGLAISEGVGESIDALIKRSDDALYIAKAAGRNCVQVAAPAKL